MRLSAGEHTRTLLDKCVTSLLWGRDKHAQTLKRHEPLNICKSHLLNSHSVIQPHSCFYFEIHLNMELVHESV